MITIETARALMTEKLVKYMLESPDSVKLEILDSETLEFSWGWVFFYNSTAYIQSGNDVDKIAGNAPVIVERESGRLFETGTAYAIESYIESYEKTGSPNA